MKRSRIICPEVAVNGQTLPGKSIFLNCLKKSKFFGNLPGKIEIFDPDPRPPRFQTRLTPLNTITLVITARGEWGSGLPI